MKRVAAIALVAGLSAFFLAPGPATAEPFARIYDAQCFSKRIFILAPPFLPPLVPADAIPHTCTNALAFDTFTGTLAISSGSVFGVLGIDIYHPPYSSASTPAITISPGGLTHPRQIAWDGSGNFWVADDTVNKVFYFRTPFSASSMPAAQNTLATQPVGLAIDPAARLMFIGDNGGSKACALTRCRIYVVPAPYTGIPAATIMAGNSTPSAMTVDRLGRLFVGFDNGDFRGLIKVYVPPFFNGQLAAYTLNAGDGVESLAFDRQNLYAQLYTGAIVTFNGPMSGSLTLPGIVLGCPPAATCTAKNWAGMAFGP